MSEQVTVSSVGEGKPWKDEITYWDVVFNRNGQDFACSWGKKGDGPVVGESVEGEFFQKNNEWRFRKASKPPSGGAPSGGSEARTGTGGGGKSGRDLDASIARQVALKVLSSAICQANTFGPELRRRVNEIESFILEAGEAASQRAGGSAPNAAVPDPAAEKPPADTEQRDLEMAIDSASAENLSAEARTLIASYMLSELDEADRTRAFNQLTNSQDPQAQGLTIRAMKQRTVNWTGAPLPTADDHDEMIPF